jgi:hypothetical protein
MVLNPRRDQGGLMRHVAQHTPEGIILSLCSYPDDAPPVGVIGMGALSEVEISEDMSEPGAEMKQQLRRMRVDGGHLVPRD